MLGQLLRDYAIEFLGDDAPVEGVFEPDFVGRVHEVYMAVRVSKISSYSSLWKVMPARVNSVSMRIGGS